MKIIITYSIIWLFIGLVPKASNGQTSDDENAPCSCAISLTEERVDTADIFIYGKVVKILDEEVSDRTNKTSTYGIKAKILIEENWRSDITDTHVIIESFKGDPCAVEFCEGKRYIIYANKIFGKNITDKCTGTRLSKGYSEDVFWINKSFKKGK